jgi:glycosyltransferase involved in cell wall biosynthesis
MSPVPRVTIGVTTYNNGRYLAGAFDDLLAQDFSDFEVVVCDNCSTDDTWAICEAYAEKDSRFRIYRNDGNLGHARSFERVVSLARGEFFRKTSHDDRIAPSLLRVCVAALDANPNAVLAYPRGIVIDADGNEVFPCADEPDIQDPSPAARVAHAMAALTYCNALFGVIRTDVLRRSRLLQPFGESDQPFVIEMAARGALHLVPQPLFYRRGSDDGASYGGAANVRDRDVLLEPQLAGKRAPLRGRARNDRLRVYAETVYALGRSELPIRHRIATIGTFSIVWPASRARIRLGAWRQRVGARRAGATPTAVG